MYQREALWLGFHGTGWKPNAVKVAVGGVNALTGESDGPALTGEPQNYLVTPLQPWLDGIKTGRDRSDSSSPCRLAKATRSRPR